MRVDPDAVEGPTVIDASVVVEYLVVSKATLAATKLFRRVLDGNVELWAPDLLYPESASALRRLSSLGAVEPMAATAAVSKIAELPIQATGTASLLLEAWDLRQNVTIYDACYAALAQRVGGPMVTADAKLARALDDLGRTVVLLE